MKVNAMNGKQLAEEVIKRFDSIEDEEGFSVWMGDCQERFGKLSEDEREIFLNTLHKNTADERNK